MWTQDILIELTRHLNVKDIVNLAQVNKKSNRLMLHELIWQEMFPKCFFSRIVLYETYFENFKLAWKLLHPLKYSALVAKVENEYIPLYVFSGTNRDLIADKIIEIYNSEPEPEPKPEHGYWSFNYCINEALMRTFKSIYLRLQDCNRKLHDLTREEVKKMLNTPHSHLSLEPIPIYEHPGRTEEMTKEIMCFYHNDAVKFIGGGWVHTFMGYRCFLGTTSREEILSMLVYLLNEDDTIVCNSHNARVGCLASRGSRDGILIFLDPFGCEEGEQEFKTNITSKVQNRSLTFDDIKYIIDNEIDYDGSPYVLKALPFAEI